MAGVPSRRQAVGLRICFCLLTASLLSLSRIGVAQSVILSGSQSNIGSVPFRVLDQHKVYFGKHSVTYNLVAPPALPTTMPIPQPSPVAPVVTDSNAADIESGYIFCSATVYDHQWSVIQWMNGDNGFVAISNIDFSELDFGDFTFGNTDYGLYIALDEEVSASADSATADQLTQAQAALPQNRPAYVIVSGTASAETLQMLDVMHGYFAANEAQLVSAYQAQQARSAALILQSKLHPQVRPSTVINYWPIKSCVYSTSSNQ